MIRNGVLDGLRGLAIGLVLLFHFGYCEKMPFPFFTVPIVRDIVRCGWMGVVLFFVLSGYLILGNLIRERSKSAYFKCFFLKRASRILPVYLILVFSLFFVGFIWSPNRFAAVHNGIIPMWAYFLFIQNGWTAQTGSFGGDWMGVTWSLAVEVQYYVFIVFVVYLCPKRYISYVMVLMVSMSILIRWYILMTSLHHFTAMHVLTLARMDSFAFGGCLAIIPFKDQSFGFRWLVGWLSVGCIVFCMLVDVGKFGSFPYVATAFNYTILSFGFAGLVNTAMNSRWIGWFFSLKGLRIMGLWSYFLYLFHLPLLRVINELFWIWVPDLYASYRAEMGCLSLVLLFGLAWISYEYMEKPILNWARDRCRRIDLSEAHN